MRRASGATAAAGFGTGFAREAKMREAKVNVVYFMTRLECENEVWV